VLDLTRNLFRKLPPALTAATCLTELSLAHNKELAVAPAELEAVLGQLPLLASLTLPRHLESDLSDIFGRRNRMSVQWK
jgi:hypothetical protein